MRFALGVIASAALGATLAVWLQADRAPVRSPARGALTHREPAKITSVIPPVRGVRQRDLEVRDPRYDPVALLREEEGRVRTHEIFEGEPRDPRFAPIFERRVTARLDTVLQELGLAAKVSSVRVECRTLSCTISLQVDPQWVVGVYDLVNGVSLGDVQSPGYEPSAGVITLDVLFRGDARRDDYDATFVSEAFTPALDFAKQRQQQVQKQP